MVVKRVMSIWLAMMIAAMCLPAAVGAQTQSATPDEAEPLGPLLLGDADLDRRVTIMDATCIQRYLAGMLEWEDDDAIACAEVDNDGDITILDVTVIQQHLARIETGCEIGEELDGVLQRRAEEERRRQEEDQKQQKIKEITARISAFKTMKGVDISSMNGAVDMKKLKSAGYQFVMIRCGYGGNYTFQDDTRFEENVKKAEAAGLYWGTYLYSYALNTLQAKSEVQHTLRLLKGKKPTMPVAFDMEDGDGYKAKNGMPTNAELCKICMTYLDGIAAAGYYPSLYTGLYWLNHIITDKTLLKKYDLWVAQWYTKCEYTASNVGMWQYGGETNYLESPTIPGLSGKFDKNYCYKDYPDIIQAYGYNNWPAIVEKNSIAGVSAMYDDTAAQDVHLPAMYHGYMGMSQK